MVRALLLFFFFLFLARAVWRLLEGVVRGAAGGAASGSRRPGTSPAVKMTPCPICGTYVVPGRAITGVSQGRPADFCSETCRAKAVA
ncbi:MAG: hypothetical protein IT178_11410 [Acidobacteria bacterium]|nr:hypothetical protein [Acidobacteriota bacterium]